MATPPSTPEDSTLSNDDPREAWTPGDNDDEADEAASYVPWKFREGDGTLVNIGRVARRHPWANAEAAPTEEAPVLTWRARWQASRLHAWGQFHWDQWLGWQEARHQRRRHRPSPRAVTEWLAYYQGLYRGHEPQPEGYARLLTRNGIPDWPNPYRPGDTGYYDFHPEGLLAADLEAILQGVQQDWAVVPERDATVERHRQVARLCWALVVSRPEPLDRIARRLHVANLRLATMDAALSPDLDQVGLTAAQVRAAAQVRGWQRPDPENAALQQMITDLSDRL